MHSQSPIRPAGPRASNTTTAPLTIKKTGRPVLKLPSATPLASSPAPEPESLLPIYMNGLSVSPTPGRLPTPKAPSLKVNTTPLSFGGGSGGGGDSPTYDYYGGGPGALMTSSDNHPEDATIQPQPSTFMPPATKTHEPLHKVRAIIHEIDNRPATSASRSDSDLGLAQGPLTYSDEVFEQLQRLGEGAGGAVHKVKDKRTGEVMARKTITTREAPMKQLLREIEIISSSAHENIICFHGVYISPSTSEVNIVMEYCPGGSLEAVGKRIKERNAIVGEKIAGRLAEGVLQGLAYLHSLKRIHRDIKPSNVLLSKEGVVKLCDFGVSGELVESLAGTFTGTSFYMAPERISGSDYTIRSDVWSTGISLLELVQNRFPFPHNDMPPIELMMYITTAEPPRLEDEGDVSWSPEMKDFIRQALTVDASLRPTPEALLRHPWISNVMKQRAHMSQWIRAVWGWPAPAPRKPKDVNGRRDPSESPPQTGSPSAT